MDGNGAAGDNWVFPVADRDHLYWTDLCVILEEFQIIM